jgi:hypothetical protein
MPIKSGPGPVGTAFASLSRRAAVHPAFGRAAIRPVFLNCYHKRRFTMKMKPLPNPALKEIRHRASSSGSAFPGAKLRGLLSGVILSCLCGYALAQDAGVSTEPTDGPVINQADVTNPMLLSNRVLTCGDIVTSGTPIAGNAAGGGNSGEIEISGVPATATVGSARLYWTVLTDNAEATETGKTISFDGNVVSGELVGFAAETPCFPQANTFAWTADVTSLVTSPGNGIYALAGFPGDNNQNGPSFTEGVSLVITYADPAAPAKAIVTYEGLAVVNAIGETLHQTLQGFETNGVISATWVPVVGNGQIIAPGDELIEFSAGAGALNFDSALDGSTAAFPAGTCSYLDVPGVQCFWDDDSHDVSTAFNAGDLFADVNYTQGTDCHSFVAMDLAVSVGDAGICEITGQQVDAACPPTEIWGNHGEYVSCVAQAAEESLAGLTCLTEEQLEEIHGCVVSERARSDVGKP